MQIILILIAIAGLMIFSVTTRNHITSTLTTAGYLVQGAWARRPTTGQALRIIAIPIALMFVPWLIFFIIMAWLGAQFNAPQAGMWIGILLPIWSFLFIIRKIHPFRILYRVIATILLIAILLFLIGFWSPGFKDAFDERHGDIKVAAENSLRKGSAHSERNAGVRGRVKSATGVYDDFRKQIKNKFVPAGKIIMILNFKGKPATEDSEALSLVMLSNEYGNFVGGEKVWMPTLKIEFVNNEEQENFIVNTKSSTASTIPGESWRMCWQEEKKEQWCGDIVVLKTSDQVKIRGTCKDGSQFFLTGDQTMEKNSYQGIWNNRNWKETFSLAFDLESQSAKGWFRDPESHKDVPMWLNKKD